MPTFLELQDEVIGLRFNERKRADIKKWINRAGRELWQAEDWDFKILEPISFTTTANTHRQSLAGLTDPEEGGTLVIEAVLELANELDDPLQRVEERDFYREWPQTVTPPAEDIGRPWAFAYRQLFLGDASTVERLLLGPAPETSETYRVTCRRGWVDLVDDADVPRMPDGGAALIPAAVIKGLAGRGDPTDAQFVEQYQAAYNALLIGHVNALGPPEYPRDPL